jgi:hypothetical protein
MPQMSPEVGHTTVATEAGQLVYIRVRRALLLPERTPDTNPPTAGPPPTGHLYLIKGTFEDIGRYAHATVDWLIKIAHFICSPRDAGQLYTHTTGTVSDWHDFDRTSIWKQGAHGDLLRPGIYEFESTSPIVLSKISERHPYSLHSVVTSGSRSNATTFARRVGLRDGGRCVVTTESDSPTVIASRLIPMRMGSDGAQSVMTRFSGGQEAIDIHSFDPRIGILLFSSLDSLVTHYELGFYHDTVSDHRDFGILVFNLMLFRVTDTDFITSMLRIPTSRCWAHLVLLVLLF